MTDDVMERLSGIRSEIFEEIDRIEDVNLFMHEGNYVSAAFELGRASITLFNIASGLTEIIGDEGGECDD